MYASSKGSCLSESVYVDNAVNTDTKLICAGQYNDIIIHIRSVSILMHLIL